ncbi:MAG TPA: CTP synthase (glutamine hydrolyzing) [Thermoplasmata archaeon]|nr:CTP synthase (glutamine hydrolyzing) [Thermoplasmata archaeon]
MKVLVVSGGVISGLGKGITTSSLGRLLKARGVPVTIVKIDPYLNVDAGTMNPYQHGEVFVLDDGTEADLDLGNYERFLGQSISGTHNLTTGKIYRAVIDKERRGDYLGNTVQIIPHVTGEIKRTIREIAEVDGAEVVLVEVGGTVGDIESMPFLEALRELSYELGEGHMAFVHTTLVPVVGPVGEAKTKPTQHSVRELRAIGIRPNVIIARGPSPLAQEIKAKISLFCDVPPEAVISVPDQSTIYEVPLVLEAQNVGQLLTRLLRLPEREPDYTVWKEFLTTYRRADRPIEVAVVGKYTELKDAYLSHTEAFHHCQGHLGVEVKLQWYDAEDLAKNPTLVGRVARSDALLVPGGFGARGVEGKVHAIEVARREGIPFLGVCYGFQMSAVEAARDLLGLPHANTTEVDPATPDPVVCLLEEQKGIADLGGTMRLGAQRVVLRPGSALARLYGRTEIWERHRHRYEINPKYLERLAGVGLEVAGTAVDGRIEAFELAGHPFFIGVQYHPEFLSRPESPHPLYLGLVRAAVARKEVATRAAPAPALA